MKQGSVGVGLISVGWMGRAHSRAYRSVPERYEDLAIRPRLVTAADPIPENRRAATELLGYETSCADYREVLAHPDVEAVSICAPNGLHREIALAAAAAAKPFWIEKPMGVSVQQATDIADAATAAGVLTAVGFTYQHAPALARAKRIIDSGRIGRITNVRVSFLADYSSDPLGPLTWRYKREQAGTGVLGDLLSHGFNLATHLAGPVRELTATADTFITQRPLPSGVAIGHGSAVSDEVAAVENEDHAAVLARFASGAVGVLEAGRTVIGSHNEYVIEVYGTEGSLRWDFQNMNALKVVSRDSSDSGYATVFAGPGDGDFGRFQPGAGIPMGFDDLKTIEAARFLASISAGRQVGPSVSDGRDAARLVDAADRSAHGGGWVTVA